MGSRRSVGILEELTAGFFSVVTNAPNNNAEAVAAVICRVCSVGVCFGSNCDWKWLLIREATSIALYYCTELTLIILI